jgi:hypothetical protein
MIESKDIGKYIVYSDGKVFSNIYNRWLAQCVNKKTGYVTAGSKYIHRLVAQCFIPNPLQKRTVNHKDGNKQNNDVSNLEWMTYSENHIHAFNKLGRTPVFKNKLHSAETINKMKETAKRKWKHL